GGLVRTFAKVLRFRAAENGKIRRFKSQNKLKDDEIYINGHQHQGKVDSIAVNGDLSKSFAEEDEKLRNRAALEAFLAKLFASISSVKADYAQLQMAQSPYDPDGIQAADELVVSELKRLSELKQCYLKQQMDPSPQVTQLLAEIQEQQSLLKTYGIMGKKFESQLKVKESEITFLREKLKESQAQSRILEKKLSPSGVSGPLSVLLDDLHLSGLNPNHFITVLRFAGKSIRSFVKVMIEQMKSAGWDIEAAADSIEPNVVYAKPNDECFAFECFLCREMFDGFHISNFSLPNVYEPERDQRQSYFFARFTELKSAKPMEFLTQKPRSPFGKFCRAKYLKLVHPKMESSFFGDLNQRNLVNAGGYPETAFFATFAEMAKRVWLLHCLAFSFEPEASIFQVRRGCRFSEVYMESVSEHALMLPVEMAGVGFTVVPGFRIRKTVIQCQVYLSPA
ncbi:protein GRAVITROPIC IN THE LIGHT 1-like, partial [Telopea speciosissima]|uniref:protein GRAVITROPIC IN THE LIGHT 1-like n=1 Tax=Telopea speciosissima TaxID=54955 RepID=UPI001CC55C72